MYLPFSQACENNKHPILAQLRLLFKKPTNVFEIGSGTGQHAVFFAEQLPHVCWQSSDCPENVESIQRRIDLSGLANLPACVQFEVGRNPWFEKIENVFSANTAHIMAWPLVEKMIDGVGHHLRSGGFFVLYGPFNYRGQYTSESNRAFDAWLMERSAEQGIRDFEAIDHAAQKAGLRLWPCPLIIACWYLIRFKASARRARPGCILRILTSRNKNERGSRTLTLWFGEFLRSPFTLFPPFL